MRRPLTLLLSLLLLLTPLFAGCGASEPPVTEEEIFPIVRELLPATARINNILLGDGIPTGNEAFGEYLFADSEWEEREDLHSVEDILRAVRAVYTDAIYTVLYQNTIIKDGQEPPDIQNRGAPATGILVYADREGWYENTTHEYLTETMTLTAATAESATVTVTVRITPEGQPPQERLLTLPLVKTADGWRCDKLTCIAYLPLVD